MERSVLPVVRCVREDVVPRGSPTAASSILPWVSSEGPRLGPAPAHEHATSAEPHKIVAVPASVRGEALRPERGAADRATVSGGPVPAQAVHWQRPEPVNPSRFRQSEVAEPRSPPGKAPGPAMEGAMGGGSAMGRLKRKLSGVWSGVETSTHPSSTLPSSLQMLISGEGPASAREGSVEGPVVPRGDKQGGVEAPGVASAAGGVDAGSGGKGSDQSDSGHSCSSQIFDGRRKRQRSDPAKSASEGPGSSGRQGTATGPLSHKELAKGRGKVRNTMFLLLPLLGCAPIQFSAPGEVGGNSHCPCFPTPPLSPALRGRRLNLSTGTVCRLLPHAADHAE